MSLFSSANSFLGLDLGTSSVKVVELVNRRQRIEVSTYASVDFTHQLIAPTDSAQAVTEAADVVNRLLDEAEVSSDIVIAALPSSIVFSTVINLPPVADADMDNAVRFAARDIVPANLDETTLTWSRLGSEPHMEGERPEASVKSSSPPASPAVDKLAAMNQPTVPVFVTAAPKNVIERYTEVITKARLTLAALEVETFPLVRSLFSTPNDSGMIVDIGDQVTTYHIIDTGTPRVSHSVDYGGHDMTAAVARDSQLTPAQAEAEKVKYGLMPTAPEKLKLPLMNSAQPFIDKAQQLLTIYSQRYHRTLNKTILIGGGANLKNLAAVWSNQVKHKVFVGDPWKGLSYPNQLANRMQTLGPNYAVAVGLAQRGIGKV